MASRPKLKRWLRQDKASLFYPMTAEQLKSQAFQVATLKSEAYRITGLIFLLTALVPFTIVRSVALGHYSLLVAQLVCYFGRCRL